MSNRINQYREANLQPKRIKFAIDELEKMGINAFQVGETMVQFAWKNKEIRYFPYSGWHTGKSINDGRGWEHLKDQLKNSNN